MRKSSGSGKRLALIATALVLLAVPLAPTAAQGGDNRLI